MGVAIFGHIHVVDFFLRCESCVDCDSVVVVVVSL